MNPFEYHHPIPQPSRLRVIPIYYATGEPYPLFVAILDTPNTSLVNQEPARSYTRNHYIPNPRPENTFNRFGTFVHEYEAYLDERLMMVELERQLNPSTNGSGLSEEEISKHLHVYTAQGTMIKDCEADICSICLCDCVESEKIGRLECGHQYHAVCIKRWLLSKNTCPMCRSDALRV